MAPRAPRISAYSTGPLGDNKLSAGSIAGGGNFRLGQNELTVGGNNLSTNVTGVIADGGTGGGTSGSLVKTGTGTMTLSGANTYTGATTVERRHAGGERFDPASSGVTVNSGGTLGGTGTVGNTTIASGGSAGARQFDRHAGGPGQSDLQCRQLLHGRGLADRRRPHQRDAAPRR